MKGILPGDLVHVLPLMTSVKTYRQHLWPTRINERLLDAGPVGDDITGKLGIIIAVVDEEMYLMIDMRLGWVQGWPLTLAKVSR